MTCTREHTAKCGRAAFGRKRTGWGQNLGENSMDGRDEHSLGDAHENACGGDGGAVAGGAGCEQRGGGPQHKGDGQDEAAPKPLRRPPSWHLYRLYCHQPACKHGLLSLPGVPFLPASLEQPRLSSTPPSTGVWPWMRKPGCVPSPPPPLPAPGGVSSRILPSPRPPLGGRYLTPNIQGIA